jgi:tetratricopeptide (TPR) repeat protein
MSKRPSTIIIGVSEEQARYYEKILRVIDKEYEYYDLGEACFKKGDYEKALTFYNKQIELHPDCRLSYLRIIEIYENSKKYDLAIEKLKTLMEKYTADWGKPPLAERLRRLEAASRRESALPANTPLNRF